MKILYLNDDFPPSSVGGAGIVTFNLAKAISTLGHEVSVMTTTRNRNEEGHQKQDGLNVWRIYSRYHRRWVAYLSLYNPQTTKKIAQIISQIKPDVVHAQNLHFYLSYYCLKLAKNIGAKVFLTVHDMMLINNGKIKIPKEAKCDDFEKYCRLTFLGRIKEFRLRYNPFRNFVIRQYLNKYVDKIFCFSHIQKKILALNGINNTEVIHSAVDPGAYVTDPKKVIEFKVKHGLVDKKIVLFGGRISKDKGIEQILEAFTIVSKKISNVILVIAGSDGLGFEEMDFPVKFMGWLDRENMKLLMSASDVIVFPSICFDVFGMMILEAMAAEKPVIGTCFGGAPEAVVDGETGYIVNPYDSKSIAERIIALLSDDNLARAFGKAGYLRVNTLFDMKDQIKKLLDWYLDKIN